LEELTGKVIDLKSIPSEKRRMLEEIDETPAANGNQILKNIFQKKE
jgi:hypothetical protein